ncbi:MAG: HEAT repeat domain-containing protein [Bryobacteraceae bacterium]|nr:HEAT repeat domain-containing protein [Bryobacteraceae bacterium]
MNRDAMNCETVRRNLSLFLYDELSLEEEDALQSHLESCQGCQAALASEQAMHRGLDRLEAPVPAGLLVQCRNGLRSGLREASAPARKSIWQSLWDLPLLLGPALKPMGAVALVAVGFLGARFLPTSVPGVQADTPAAKVRYITSEPDGSVRLVVDETRQRTLTGSLDDERIRGLLLEAAKDPANPGLRVETMDIFCKRGSDNEEVRTALLQALQHDTNVGVRLKALEGLKPFAGDVETRKALARVLLSDENPGVRAQAVDLLVQQKNVDTVGVLQELMRRESNDYIRLRGQRALREMNASVESF